MTNEVKFDPHSTEPAIYSDSYSGEYVICLSSDNESYNALNHSFKYKHLWIKKSTGLGVTGFFLRLMAWLCLRNDDYKNSQMCIVRGPNIDIAIKLIKRMKGSFASKLGVTFDNKETVLELNGRTIEAYPSNHIDAYRALDNPKFILIDEGDLQKRRARRCKTCI